MDHPRPGARNRGVGRLAHRPGANAGARLQPRRCRIAVNLRNSPERTYQTLLKEVVCMVSQLQIAKAEAFRQMHEGRRILVLPNAWDAASARIFEDVGFKAVATTSAGVSYTAGYPDGEAIPRDDMMTMVRWIARSVDVPVTADIESGFGDSPREVAETVRMIIEAGAIGINLEDSIHSSGSELYDLSSAVERIRAARAAAQSAGIPIVINGRTDVFLLGIGEKASRFDHAVRRLNAYREAGADCLYPIGFLECLRLPSWKPSVSPGSVLPRGLCGLP